MRLGFYRRNPSLSVLLSTLLALWISGGLGGCIAPRVVSISDILAACPDKFAAFTSRPAEFRLQIVLSEVTNDSAGRPMLRRSVYRPGAEYFYPASAIKLCAAVAAVQKLDSLPGATIDDPLTFYPLFAGEEIRDRDPTNLDGGTITLRHEIRKLFLISDNEAFNRLYEFVGHRELNQRMHALGLESVVINHRLSSVRTADENRLSPRIDIATRSGPLTLPPQSSDLVVRSRGVPGLMVGSGFMNSKGEVSVGPVGFSERNAISIIDLQDLLIMLTRPDVVLDRPSLQLSLEHCRFLLDTMAEYPAASRNPKYDRAEYPDDYGKFFLPGLTRVCSKEHLRIMNKVGQAYGFTIDNACIVDERTGHTLFLTAVIYTNSDGILNDDKYDYETVAMPFMADLAEQVARARLCTRAATSGERKADRSAVEVEVPGLELQGLGYPEPITPLGTLPGGTMTYAQKRSWRGSAPAGWEPW